MNRIVIRKTKKEKAHDKKKHNVWHPSVMANEKKTKRLFTLKKRKKIETQTRNTDRSNNKYTRIT